MPAFAGMTELRTIYEFVKVRAGKSRLAGVSVLIIWSTTMPCYSDKIAAPGINQFLCNPTTVKVSQPFSQAE